MVHRTNTLAMVHRTNTLGTSTISTHLFGLSRDFVSNAPFSFRCFTRKGPCSPYFVRNSQKKKFCKKKGCGFKIDLVLYPPAPCPPLGPFSPECSLARFILLASHLSRPRGVPRCGALSLLFLRSVCVWGPSLLAVFIVVDYQRAAGVVREQQNG
jgi:hypothetical protein